MCGSFIFYKNVLCRMVVTLSLEEQAMAEWLERDSSVDVVAKKFNLPKFDASVKNYFTRFVNAAEAYHDDKTGDLTHRSAAYSAGLEVWMYELFLSKFKVDRDPGIDGQERIKELKRDPFYQSGL